MIDLKQAAIDLRQERQKLESDIQRFISEFESKTGFKVQDIIIKEIDGYGGKVIRLYSVKLEL